MTFGFADDGIIQQAGAWTPDWISNLGIDLTAGVLSIVDAQGATITSSNPGWVTVPSTTAGQLVTLPVTTALSFNDDSHASSSLGGLGWGLTETVAWAQDRPFFLYVVNRANSDLDGTAGNSCFFLSAIPNLITTPSDGDNIGDNGTIPVNDTQNVILIMDDITPANYTSLPCQLIGTLRMQWSTVTDDWTCQAIGTSDGLGEDAIRRTEATVWTFPAGQNGADASNYFSSGATAPVWATPGNIIAKYKINRAGECHYYFSTRNAGNATNGSGGTSTLFLYLPYLTDDSTYPSSTVGNMKPIGCYTATSAATASGTLVGDHHIQHTTHTYHTHTTQNNQTVNTHTTHTNTEHTHTLYTYAHIHDTHNTHTQHTHTKQ